MRQEKNICGSCRFLKTAQFGATTVSVCDMFEKKITRFADNCNKHIPRDSISLNDMYSSAWILEKKRKPGFEVSQWDFKEPTSDGHILPPTVGYD